MSEENVEVVRRFYDAVNRRDLRVLDGLLASEESEFASVFAVSEGRVYRGRQSAIPSPCRFEAEPDRLMRRRPGQRVSGVLKPAEFY